MKALAILISGSGTGSNLQAIISAINSHHLTNTRVAVVVSDSDNAVGFNKAKKAGIPTHVLQKGGSLEKLLTTTFPVDYVVLAGWKKIIPESFITRFHDKILNIHPGLIPDTLDGCVVCPDNTKALWNKGMYAQKAIENFLSKKATYAGSSIHFLTEEFDFGPVISRGFEKILPTDTVETLYERLKKIEHHILIESLKKLGM